MNFKSPFLLTYLATSLLALYLPLWQMWIACGIVKTEPIAGSAFGSISTISGVESETADSEDIVNQLHEDVFSDTASVDGEFANGDLSQVIAPKRKSYTHMDVIKIALIISPLWFLSNCLYNYSLLMTSVSSSTIIR